MGSFFNMDGPFYKFGNILADIMILSLIWLVFSLPIVTIGASTTALYYVTTRRISEREGYIFRDFWSSFKSNFKQATIVWLIMILLGAVLITNILNMNYLNMPDILKIIMQPMQLVFLIELVLNGIYIFPIISRFEMKLKDVFKTTFYMVHKHLLTTIILIALGILVFIIGYNYEIFFIIAMGCYAFAASYFLMKVFKKYRPEMDADPLELELLMQSQAAENNQMAEDYKVQEQFLYEQKIEQTDEE